jgi:type IV secretion system protein VirB10
MSDDLKHDARPPEGGNAMEPLHGEPGIPSVAGTPRSPWSKKGLLAVALLVASLIAVSALAIQRFVAGSKKADDDPKLVADRPAAATAQPRRLEMLLPARAAAAGSAAVVDVPAIDPAEDVLAEPIGVRRTGRGGAQPSTGGNPPIDPQDAPVMIVSSSPSGARHGEARAGSVAEENRIDRPGEPSDPLDETRRNLQDYQRQLRGLLDSLTKSAAAATGQDVVAAPTTGASLGLPLPGGVLPHAGGLFGGQMQGSATPRVAAVKRGDRSLTLPKGTAFTCALKTKVISATSGMVGCQVQRNVFGDDGRVLLIERGSHLDGEYRITSVRPGTVRIPVLWTRIRTRLGVTVDVESPGTGQLGESGIEGHVDNRWGERIGAAMLLSLIDDSVKLVIQNQANDTQADTILLPSTTANTSKLAEKVLESTINIPPLIYQNQGGIVGIHVARDVDFSSVYELRPTALDLPRESNR